MAMKSPFEYLVLDAIDVSFSDEEILGFFAKEKMKKHMNLHLRYRSHLDNTTSVNIEQKKELPRVQSHRHSDRVGILMVGNKRPVRVRFDVNDEGSCSDGSE